ncbi:MAG: cytochrome c biogenesis protein CcsA, partial [Rhodospirillales bacterium]
MLHHFANPTRFQRLSTCLEPWVLGIMLVCFAAGLYFALFASPVDYQQGHTVRIMYIHVPAAWMALFCYTAMAVSAAVALIWKHALA